MTQVAWKQIEGYEKYEVSSQGQIRRAKSQRALKPIKRGDGRMTVSLSREGESRHFTVHSLVAAAFIGPRPQGLQIDHVDGDFTKNPHKNLEYVTPAENVRRFVVANGGYKVNLTRRVSLPGKDLFCPVVFSGNGRVKPGWVVVNGKEVHIAGGGAYYIDWTQGKKRIRRSVGKDATTAVARKLRKETELAAVEQGIAVAGDPEKDKRRELVTAAVEYLAEIALTKKLKTLQAYTTSSKYFLESCTKTYIEQLDRKDMVKFAAFLRDKKGLADRTCWNKFNNTMSFLKAMGVTAAVGVNANDWPSFVEEDVEIYERDELDTLLGACSPDDQLLWKFFLMTGKREQEVMYTTWKDVIPSQLTVAVRYKPRWNWKPKGYREREIPVPEALMALLEARRPSKVSDELVFPSIGGGPEGHFLRRLKECATAAHLDPANFWLHKFRATFCTTHLRAGTDLATVQKWAGHRDLASTMRYLQPARGEAVRGKVELAFA